MAQLFRHLQTKGTEADKHSLLRHWSVLFSTQNIHVDISGVVLSGKPDLLSQPNVKNKDTSGMQDKRITMTGGKGFPGKHLIKAFQDKVRKKLLSPICSNTI